MSPITFTFILVTVISLVLAHGHGHAHDHGHAHGEHDDHGHEQPRKVNIYARDVNEAAKKEIEPPPQPAAPQNEENQGCSGNHGDKATPCDHGHSHDEKKEGHGHSHGDHGHSHGDHGHSHGEKKEGHGHSHGDHGHSHGDHGHSHGEKKEGHGHSHGDHGHSHGEKKEGHGHSHGEKKEGHGHSHGEKKEGHGHSHGDHGHSHGEKKEGHGHSHGAQLPKPEPVVTSPVSEGGEDSAKAGCGCGGDHFEFESLVDTGARPELVSQVWVEAMLSTLLISAVPAILLIFVPIDNSPASHNVLKVLLAFASGGLLGDALLHLIPHASHPHSHGAPEEAEDHHHGHSHGHEGHDHGADMEIGLGVLAGIMVFMLVEKLVRSLNSGSGHGHSHGGDHAHEECHKDEKKKDAKADSKSKPKEDDTKTVAPVEHEHIEVAGYLNLAADFAHNFTDGLAIGASFLVDRRLALITTFTVLLHEIPHELGDFAILIKSGCSKSKAIKLQLVTAIGALLGTALGLASANLGQVVNWILPFTAGGFIYIATVTIIPELLQEATLWQSIKEVIAMSLGVLSLVLMIFIE